MTACTPTFNWRQVRAEPAPITALMPCKPERGQRRVAMTEAGVDLHLMRCDAGGLTFALAWAQLAPGDDSEVALQRWHSASLLSWQVEKTAAGGLQAAAATVPGLRYTWQGMGRDHRGQPLPLRSAYGVRGQWVFQALVAGAPTTPELVTTFWDSL